MLFNDDLFKYICGNIECLGTYVNTHTDVQYAVHYVVV